MESINTEKPKHNKAKKVWNIISWILVILFTAFVGFQLVQKISGQTIYWGGVRVDVVLTDSMSEKHPEYASFLEGHDDQLQPYDLTYCRKVDENTPLAVYDIVIFDSPIYGPTIHRIVDIVEQDGTTYYVTRGDKLNTVDGKWFRSRIIAKYEGSTPKLGYVVYFFRSIWGMVAIEGLVAIYVIYKIATYDNKKKNANEQ